MVGLLTLAFSHIHIKEFPRMSVWIFQCAQLHKAVLTH